MPDNAAEPILKWKDKLASLGSKDKKSAPPAKVDTSWHDQMVKQANESFRKQAEQKKISVDATKPAQKKPVAKTSAARKRISSK